MEDSIFTEAEFRELWRLQRFYWKEAIRCEKSKAYLAGCVMLGSALETLLILMIDVHWEEAQKTRKAPSIKGNLKPLLKWNLAELLAVTKAAGWLPSAFDLNDDWNSRKAKVGEYAEAARMIRNLAHPARYLKDHRNHRVTRKYLQRQFEIVLACRDWLALHNNKQLLKELEEDENQATFETNKNDE